MHRRTMTLDCCPTVCRLVTRLHAAQPRYRVLAGELLDAVDRLEAVFKKKGRP